MRTCLTVKMARSELARLDQEAKKHRLSRSAWVRQVLDQALASKPPKVNWAEHFAWRNQHAAKVHFAEDEELDSKR